MKRVGLVMQGGAEWIGGQQYVLNLARSVRHYAGDRVRVVVIGVGGEAPAEADGCADEVVWLAPPRDLPRRVAGKIMFRTLRRDLSLELAVSGAQVDFVYPYFPGRWLPRGTKSATWIADFQHLRMPEMFSAREIRLRTQHFRRVIRHAKRVVLSSEAAERDLRRFFGVPRGLSHVLRFHTFPEDAWFDSDPAEVRRKYGLPERFFVVSNQFWKHKNHAQVFDAVERLHQGGAPVAVVCTGRINDYRSPGYAQDLVKSLEARGLAEAVTCLGIIPRHDQMMLMRDAVAVVQPSLFEGWSTVVEDARCLGVPLLMSQIDVHIEQAPHAGKYFAVGDVSGLADLMADAWANPVPALAPQSARAGALARSHQFVEQFLELLP